MDYNHIKQRAWQSLKLAISLGIVYLKNFEKLFYKHPWVNRFIYEQHKLRQSPYARLIRLNDLSGLWLLVLPVWWSICFASLNYGESLGYSILAFLGALLLRAAGCLINDIFDRDYDGRVRRTASRPLASGEVSLRSAILLLVGLLLLTSSLLIWLPALSTKMVIVSIIPIFLYPLVKRYTDYAQVFLGLTFNSGVLVMWIAVNDSIRAEPIILYLAAVLWTIAYDTIYAYQDREDDMRLGLKSLAVKLGHSANKQIWNCYELMMILMGIVGLLRGMNLFFFALLAGVAYLIYPTIKTLDLKNPVSCAKAFRLNVHYGLAILSVILIGIA